MNNTVDITRDAEARFGVTAQPGLAQAWPQLDQQAQQVMNRMQGLPWVPTTWSASVAQFRKALDLKGDAPLVYPRRATLNGIRLANVPDWIDTPEKERVWDEISQAFIDAKTAYAQKKLTEGLAVVSALERNAAFWRSAAALAQFFADIPAKITEGASSVFFAWLKKALPLLIALGLLVLGYVFLRNKVRE